MQRLNIDRWTEGPVVEWKKKEKCILEIEMNASVDQGIHRDNSWKSDESGSIKT